MHEEDIKLLAREFSILVKEIQNEKNRSPGEVFYLYQQGVNGLLESSSLRRSERRSLSRRIKILARQHFGPYICSSEENLVEVSTMNYSFIYNQTGTLVSPCKVRGLKFLDEVLLSILLSISKIVGNLPKPLFVIQGLLVWLYVYRQKID